MVAMPAPKMFSSLGHFFYTKDNRATKSKQWVNQCMLRNSKIAGGPKEEMDIGRLRTHPPVQHTNEQKGGGT